MQQAPGQGKWLPPKIWQDSTCVILGGGPSLADVDFELIKKRRIIAVNNAYGDPVQSADGKTIMYQPRDWVDLCWFGDSRWYGWHRKWLKQFMGMLCSCHQELRGVDQIGYLRRSPKRRHGLETRPGMVAWNGNSGASAINVAYHLGVSRVLLLGFDMRRISGKSNWHEDHAATPTSDYQGFINSFLYVAQDAKGIGLEIINCTPDSALNCFPYMTLEQALAL